jgi:two-component system, OmpR family, response regulator PrrA
MPTALVIADAQWVVDEVAAALSFGDWQIEFLADPRLAATTVKESLPEVVIIDLQVHSMGGMAIVRAVRDVFQDSPPPRMVLLLDRSADTFIARRARADASVVKPFTAAELRAAVAPKIPAAVPAGATEEE